MASAKGIFNIRAENREWFETQIAKLSKKSVRLLGFPITLDFSNYTDEKIDGRVRRVYQVYLNAPEPKLGDWEFIAKLDHANEVGNIVRVVPGKDLPPHYRDADHTNCDHCHTKRYRRDTYIVRNTVSNEYKQIGSSCLKDFLGHDVEKIAKLAEFLGYAGEMGAASEFYGVGADLRYIDLQEYLSFSAACVQKFGWLSRTVARQLENKEATADIAMTAFNAAHSPPSYTRRGEKIEPLVKVTDEDKAIAVAAVEWAQNITDDQIARSTGDYLYNIRVIAASGVIEPRSAGLAASIVGSFLRETKQLKTRANLATSSHVGLVGLRQEFGVVSVLSFYTTEGRFGITNIYRFLTADGNVLVWFASRNQGIDKGDTVTLTGTVSKHDVYKDIRQTIIKNAKLVKAEG